MFGKRKSITSQHAQQQLSTSLKGVQYHPQHPTMYFKPVFSTDEPELNFNKVEYFYSGNEICDEMKIPSAVLHEELCNSPEHLLWYSQPWRVMRLGPNDVRPAYTPIIEDVEAYMHKGGAVFLKWFCERNCPGTPEYIPREIKPILYLMIEINTDHLPKYSLPLETRDIIMGASRAGVHVMEVRNNLSVIEVDVDASITAISSNRYFHVKVRSEKSDNFTNEKRFEKGYVVIVWNTRSVHRPSFKENFARLVKAFNPMLFVLTESRAALPMLNEITKNMGGKYRIEAFGPNIGLGGVLLAWDFRVEPYFMHRQSTMYGRIVSLTTIPSYRLKHYIPAIMDMWEEDDIPEYNWEWDEI